MTDPDDPTALRALAAERDAAGDARGAWRARARLARRTDAVEDWRAVEGAPRAPRTPAQVRVLEAAGRVVSLGRDVVVMDGTRLVALGPDGAERWCLDRFTHCVPCGPDLLLLEAKLALVDHAGATVAEAARPEGAFPVFQKRVTGDRLVAWKWDTERFRTGRRLVLDVGERFGAVLADVPLDRKVEETARVAAGRLAGRIGPRWAVGAMPVDGTTPTWTAAPEWQAAVLIDPSGVVVEHRDTLAELDLRTGARRWSASLPGARPRALALGHGHLLALIGGVLSARERGRGEVAWQASSPDARGAWVVGDEVVVLHRPADARAALAVRDLERGAERWRLPLPVAIESFLAQDGVAVGLHAGDGALGLKLERAGGLSGVHRLVWVSE